MKRLENPMDTIVRLAGAVFASRRPIGECRQLSIAAVALIMTFGALWSGDVRAQACNIATNGSFESPNIQTEPQRAGENTAYINGYAIWRTTTYPIDGWQTVSGTVDFLRHYNNASHGAQSLDLYGTAAATFRQTFTGLVPGRQYSFSIDYSGHSAASSTGAVQLGNGSGATPVTLATLRPAVDSVSNGNAGIPATPSYTVTWRTYQHTFTATGTEATIQFVNTGVYGGTGLFIDNFTFAGVGPCEGDLSITKDNGSATYTPGLNNTYAIVVTNAGPGPVTGARVTDPLPPNISAASWSCGNATGGGVCVVPNGTGAIDTTANLPAGASVTYTMTLQVPTSYTGSLTNTATVTPPAGMTDTNPGDNDDSDTDTQELPPVSGACAPRAVVPGDSFTLSPFPVTGSVTKVGAFGTGTAQWASAGGNYTITWTFSSPVPAQWLRIGLTHVDSPNPNFTFSVSGTADRTDFAVLPGSGLAYNPATGVLTRSAAGRQAGSIQAGTNDTVTSISIQGTAIEATDSVGHILWVRPPCMTVQKVSEGGTGSFTINMTNVVAANSTPVPSTTLTTTAAGTPVSSPLYFAPSTTTDITLSEAVPAGWGITSAVCTDQNASSTGNPTVISTFATPTLTIPAANVRAEADIVCRYDNGPLPTISLAKITSQIAGGPFGFTLGNTTVVSPAPVSTSGSGSPVAVDGDPGAETAFRVSSLGADVTIDESSLPAGWIVNGASCTDAGGALVGNLAAGRYTIPAAAITMGQTFDCSFVNEPTVNLRIDKSANPTTVRSGETVTYTIVANNDGPGPGDGALVADPPVPGVDCTAATLSCSASAGAACPASLDVATFQSTGLTIPTFPAGGSLQFGMTCTVTATGL